MFTPNTSDAIVVPMRGGSTYKKLRFKKKVVSTQKLCLQSLKILNPNSIYIERSEKSTKLRVMSGKDKITKGKRHANLAASIKNLDF